MPENIRIIVCDNGSDDDSLETIRRFFQRNDLPLACMDGDSTDVEATCGNVLLSLPVNFGYAKGNNEAIRLALKSRPDYIWVLNNDTVVREDALTCLLRCAERRQNVGVWGSTIVRQSLAGTIETLGGCAYNPYTTVFKRLHEGETQESIRDNAHDVAMDYVYGASMFMRREVVEEVGLFNEQFFLYYEELDYCDRAIENGFSIGWCKDSLVAHIGGSSTRRHQSSTIIYHETRSTLLYSYLHHRNIFLVPFGIRFLGKLFFLLLRREPRHMAAVLRAYRDFLRELFTHQQA